MKKISAAISLLGLTLATHFPTLTAATYSDKMFMSIPTPHYYTAMKQTSWHRMLKQGSGADIPWGGTVQLIPFYSASNKEGGMGKYFGTSNKNALKVDKAGENVEIQSNLIMHQYNDDPDLAGILKLNPKHTTYGAYISYNQELENIQKGLYFQVNFPLVHVENNLNPVVTNETKDNMTGTPQGILDFFSGSYTNSSDKNKQSALSHAKIVSGNDKTGIADIELLIGYKLAEKADHMVCGEIKFIIPTGGRPTGEYLFPALVGNGKHWGVGSALSASMNITKSKSSSFECILSVDYKYLFKADQKRTIGYRNGLAATQTAEDTAAYSPWGHYIIGGENGKKGLFPLANILTRDVSVYPGGKLHGHASFAYHRDNTTFDFGYAFFAQEGEKVNVKMWEDDKYAPAAPEFETVSTFDVTNINHVIGGPINKTELDPNKAATPAIFKSSIYAAIAYTLSEWDNPFMLGCGVSADWTHDNSNPTGYVLWAKVGATF